MFTKLDSQLLCIYLELLSMKGIGKSIALQSLCGLWLSSFWCGLWLSSSWCGYGCRPLGVACGCRCYYTACGCPCLCAVCGCRHLGAAFVCRRLGAAFVYRHCVSFISVRVIHMSKVYPINYKKLI